MAKTDATTELETEQEASGATKRQRNRQKKSPESRAPEKSGITFWQRVANVDKADWGTRTHIYLYRTEPLTDRAQAGKLLYITKYAEPISEDRILADHGSGKYKAVLNNRKPAADQGDAIDSIYIEILNMQFPPKIPQGDWLEDPRNRKWEWAKKFYDKENDPGKQPSTLQTISEVLDVAERLRPEAPADPAASTLAIVKGVRDLFPQSDNGKMDTLVLGLLQSQQDIMRTFMQSQLEASRKETDDLKQELRSLRDNKQNPGNTLQTFKEVLNEFGITNLKDVFQQGKDVVGEVSRANVKGWQAFVLGLAESPTVQGILTPFANAVSMMMMRNAQMPANGMGQVPQVPGSLPAATGAAAVILPFLQLVTKPMVNKLRYSITENEDPVELGKEFAQWVMDGLGDDPQFETAMTATRAMGPIGLIAALKQAQPIWLDKGPNGNQPSLAEMEANLQPFLQAFLDYRESDEEPAEGDPANNEGEITFSEVSR